MISCSVGLFSMLWRYRSGIKCVLGPSSMKRRKVAALRLLRPSGKLLTLVTQVPEVGTELGLQDWLLSNLTLRRSHMFQGYGHFGCVRP